MPYKDLKKARRLCKYYQRVLGLCAWGVSVEFVSYADSENIGACFMRFHTEEADITISTAETLPSDVPYNLELTIVHELVHIRLSALKQNPGTDTHSQVVHSRAIEQAVEWLARAIYSGHKDKHGIGD